LVITPFLAYDHAMRYLAAITMLVLALAMVQPVAAQSFKPDYDAGYKAYEQKDYATALRHFRPLAKQGHTRAQTRLGWMYNLGFGVTKDSKEAVRWYRLAAKQGYAWAQNNLGWSYRDGDGVTKDSKETIRWFRLSAKQGHNGAQWNLAGMYLDGHGVVQDLVMAYVWMNVAVANGVTGRKVARDKVLARLNASERKLGLKLSKRCFKKPAKCPEYSDD
jgi:TPR repeat protein